MGRSGTPWFTVLPSAVIAIAPTAASATIYLTVPAAQQAMFPGGRFVDRSLNLTPEQHKAIAKASRVGSFDKQLHAWDVRSGSGRAGWFIVDRVLGKHEFITYAIALTSEGAVQRIEILEYRETYGGEVRNPAWRQQFVGKSYGSELQLTRDIKNISGATLSSRHITDGVRRVLATWQLLLKNA